MIRIQERDTVDGMPYAVLNIQERDTLDGKRHTGVRTVLGGGRHTR
jgi:hypothetical protein